MTGLGLLMIVMRHLAFYGIVELTLRVMGRVAQDAFARVQRFSTDWHANSFAGSTVRKITRGMWALDLMHDTLLLALLPSLTVLAGSMIVLGLRWPVMGLVDRRERARLHRDDGAFSPPSMSRRRRGWRMPGIRVSAAPWPMP